MTLLLSVLVLLSALVFCGALLADRRCPLSRVPVMVLESACAAWAVLSILLAVWTLVTR